MTLKVTLVEVRDSNVYLEYRCNIGVKINLLAMILRVQLFINIPRNKIVK